MIKSYSQGFTLIELLVVIAIIGIFSSIVLAALNTARGKGSNATIKADINNIRSVAEFYYEDTTANGGQGSYFGICTNAGLNANSAKFMNGVNAAHSASGAGGGVITNAITSQNINTTNCHSAVAGGGWVVSVPLKTPETVGATTYNYWCADSTGFAGGRINLLAGGANVITCPGA